VKGGGFIPPLAGCGGSRWRAGGEEGSSAGWGARGAASRWTAAPAQLQGDNSTTPGQQQAATRLLTPGAVGSCMPAYTPPQTCTSQTLPLNPRPLLSLPLHSYPQASACGGVCWWRGSVMHTPVPSTHSQSYPPPPLLLNLWHAGVSLWRGVLVAQLGKGPLGGPRPGALRRWRRRCDAWCWGNGVTTALLWLLLLLLLLGFAGEGAGGLEVFVAGNDRWEGWGLLHGCQDGWGMQAPPHVLPPAVFEQAMHVYHVVALASPLDHLMLLHVTPTHPPTHACPRPHSHPNPHPHPPHPPTHHPTRRPVCLGCRVCGDGGGWPLCHRPCRTHLERPPADC
jgi:hypothetical protein